MLNSSLWGPGVVLVELSYLIRSHPNSDLWYLISIPSTLLWCSIVMSSSQTPSHCITTFYNHPFHHANSIGCPLIIIAYPAHITDVTGFSIVTLFTIPVFVKYLHFLLSLFRICTDHPKYKICSCMSYFHNSNINLVCSTWTHALESPPSTSSTSVDPLKYRTISIVGTASKLKPKSVQTPSFADQLHPSPTIANQHWSSQTSPIRL